MDQFISAIILGIVEGITEFLPISSTGHLIIVNRFVNLTGEFARTFDVVIQFGAILSIIVYFRERLFPPAALRDAITRRRTLDLWSKSVFAVIPALGLGAAFGEAIEAHLFHPLVVGTMLLAGGIILILVERRRSSARIDDMASLSYRVALAIGLIQCLAMIPGTSRSAATIIGAMALGCSRRTAAEFSFFLAIPTMLAASAYSLLKLETGLTGTQWQVLATGFVVSFLVAWAVVAFLMNYIRKHDFVPFGYYRVVLGLLVLGYFGVVLRGGR